MTERRHSLERLPPELRKGFRAYHRRLRLLQSLAAIVVATVVYASLVWLAIHCERFAVMQADGRQRMLLLVHAVAGLVVLGGLGRTLFRRPPLREIASRLERADLAGTQERYSTLLDISGRDPAAFSQTERQFVEELERAALALPNHETAARLARAPAIRFWLFAAIIPALLFAVPATMKGYQLDLMLKRFYRPHAELERPMFVRLEAIAEKTVVARGDGFLLQVRRQGEVPRIWRRFMELIGRPFVRTPVIDMMAGDADAGGKAPVTAALNLLDEGLYFYSLGNVENEFRFRLRADDFSGEWQSVSVYDLPEAIDLRVEITAPAYAGGERQTIEPRQGQEIHCLKGSLVHVVFRASQPVERRQIISNVISHPITPYWDEDTNTGFYRFTFRDNDSLRILLRNSDGHENREPPVLRFETLQDKPPSVEVDSSAMPEMVSATDVIEMPIRVRDDYGVRQLGFSYLSNPVPGREAKFDEMEIDISSGMGGKELELRAVFDLNAINVLPGDVLQVRVIARDALGQIGLSHDMFLNVRSFGREINEERTVRNLRHLLQALETALESAQGVAKGEMPLGVAAPVYERIRGHLADQGMAIAAEASLKSLIRAFAEEHYFADDPRARENLRLFHASLALLPLVASWDENPVFRRNEDGILLTDRSFSPLLDERDLRNLLWRILGVQEAIERQRKLGTEGARQLLGVLDDTLLDINRRVAGIAARTGWIPATVAGDISAAIREALQPSAKKKAPSAPAVAAYEPVDELADYDPLAAVAEPAPAPPAVAAPGAPDLQRLHAALGRLREECGTALTRSTGAWLSAEERLRTFHDGIILECARRIAESEADSAWIRDELLPVLQDDASLLARDPHAPVAAMVDNSLLVAAALRTAYEPESEAGEPFTPSDSEALRKDAQNSLLLHARAAQMELLADASASAAEKVLGRDLRRRGLARLETAGSAEVEARIPAELPDFSGLAAEHEAALAGKIAGKLPPLDIEETGRQLHALYDATNGSERDNRGRRLPISIEDRKKFLMREKFHLSAVLGRLRLELMLEGLAGNELAPARARIFFSLRDFHNRPRVNPMMLEGRGQLMPEDYDNQLYANEIQEHREAVLARLESIFADDDAPHYDSENEYLLELRKAYGRLHGFGLVYRALLAAPDAQRPAMISEYVTKSEDLSKAYARRILENVQDLTAAVNRLMQAEAEASAVAALLKKTALLQDDIRTLGESRYRESLLGVYQKLNDHMMMLADTEVAASSVRYHLDALAAGLREMRQMLEFYQMSVDNLQYLGGLPDGSAVDGSFRHHESGRTLKERAETHRQRILALILDAADDGAAALHAGSFHVSCSHRIILSEFTAFRYQQPVTGTVTRERYDQHMNSVWYRNNNTPIRFYGDFWRAYTNARQQKRYGWGVPREYR